MSRPSGPVEVFQAHCATATATDSLPGHTVGVRAVAGSVPVPDGPSGWQFSVGVGTSAGLVSCVSQAAALDAPKLLSFT